NQITKNISEMINFGDNIIVGLSGGADSVALTYFLYKLSDYFKLKIIACHINHGLRGEEADKDQKFVRSYCNKLNIKLLEKNLDLIKLSKQSSKSIEELGRYVRYEFFNECSEKYKAKIATAHNLNDSVETVILNLIRGAGLKGLCGIPKSRDNIIRPFIDFTRQDIETYCKENLLIYMTDSSNLSIDYNRNLIRHRIIPVISKINPNFTSTINRNCDIILKDEEYLSKLALDILKKISYNNNYYYYYSIRELEKYEINIKNRVIKLILKSYKLPYSYQKIKIILNFIFEKKNTRRLMINNNYYIYKNNNYFEIKKINKNLKKDLNIKLFDNNTKDYINFDIIKYSELEEKIKKDKSILKKCIDLDKISGEPILRYRKDGDKIKLAYRKVTKSLKKLFNEEKISEEDRSNILIICDALGVIWVQDFGSDERVNVSSQTKNILFLY
ncbi:MAG: tRNA lysidine(34) synthetase TilS, partial [Oscillospiraceae bacterium]|nr:tRNA lysidine(34) synthetase TilS [Oscillospiraceae bacterium]